MKISDTVTVAIITVGFGVLSSFSRGIWDFFTKKSDRVIPAWEQWRKDNESLRAEITGLKTEIVDERAAFKIEEAERKRLAIENENLTNDNQRLAAELNVVLRANEMQEVDRRAVARERQKMQAESHATPEEKEYIGQ